MEIKGKIVNSIEIKFNNRPGTLLIILTRSIILYVRGFIKISYALVEITFDCNIIITVVDV